MNHRRINIEQLVWTLTLLVLGALLGLLLGPDIARFSNLTAALFVTPLIASLLGAGTAYLGIRRSQRMDAEVVKLDKLNAAVFLVVRCITALCTLKGEYFDSIGTDYYRSLTLKRNIKNIEKVDPDISSIQFLLSKQNDESNIDLVRMTAALENFNLVVDMLELRNSLHGEFLIATKKTGKYASGGAIEGIIAELEEEMGESELDLIVHTGEQLIATIDFALTELHVVQSQLQTHGRDKIRRALLDDPMFVEYKFTPDSRYKVLIETPAPKGEWKDMQLDEGNH